MPPSTRSSHPDDSYDARYFEPLSAIEDRHFWFRTRNLLISKVVNDLVKQFEPGYRILEVGCGTGNTLRVLDRLADQGMVIGMDLFFEGLRYARQRVSCSLIQADLHCTPFKTEFDLIALFDVLEHLPDDLTVLRDLHRILKPGGYLILTVPAHMSLWSYFDEASHHCRRYEYAELEAKLVQAGYQIQFMTQFMASIFPLVWLGRRVAAQFSRKSGHGIEQVHQLANEELRITPVLNQFLSIILSLEAYWLGRHHSLPIGTSLLALTQKRNAITL